MANFEPMKIQSLFNDHTTAIFSDVQMTEQRRLLSEENGKLLNARLAQEHAVLVRQNTLLRIGTASPPGLSLPQFEFPSSRSNVTTQGLHNYPVDVNLDGMLPLSSMASLRPTAEVAAQALLGKSCPSSRFVGLGGSRGGFSETGRGCFSKRTDHASDGHTTPGSRSASPSTCGQRSAPASGASSRTSSPGVRLSSFKHVCTDTGPLDQATTLIVRKIPKSCTRSQLLALMDREGFSTLYDLIYLPIDFATRTGLGFAFVNFITAEKADQFMKHFHGFCDWNTSSKKSCEVTLSCELQGFDAHVDRYRSSPVMHESVPDEFKPVIFADGIRVMFPPPTKAIKQPRLRASRQKLKTARRWGSDDGSRTPSEPATPQMEPTTHGEEIPDEF